MNQFRRVLNKRGHRIRRNCRPANVVVSRDGLAPYLVMTETAGTTKRPEDGTPSSVARKRRTGTTTTRRPESDKVPNIVKASVSLFRGILYIPAISLDFFARVCFRRLGSVAYTLWSRCCSSNTSKIRWVSFSRGKVLFNN